MIFQEKSFTCCVLLTDQISLSDRFTSRDTGQYMYYNCVLCIMYYNCSGCDVIKFEIKIYLKIVFTIAWANELKHQQHPICSHGFNVWGMIWG